MKLYLKGCKRRIDERPQRAAIFTVWRWLKLVSHKWIENTFRMKALRDYRRKRPEGRSPEPRGGRASRGKNVFVVQRHDATRLHYDFRLESGGVLKSWAVPKGPSLNPSDKRLAIQVEDHPLDYGSFEGQIPEGNYGAGEVILWDKGTYTSAVPESVEEQLRAGELKINLDGEKLKGGFVLIRLQGRSNKKEWLLIKHRDGESKQDWSIEEHDRSVKSGKAPGPSRHARRANAAGTSFTSGVQKLADAEKSELPENMRPELASSSDEPFSSDEWVYEIKWDGIRVLAVIENGATKLVSRSGRNITGEYPELKDLARNVRARNGILDGEIVVVDAEGRSDFQRLQARFGVENPSAKLQADAPATVYFFDVLYCDGYDVRRVPLVERKGLLSRILVQDDRIRISEHQAGKGIELFAAAREKGLEGVVAKRSDSRYTSGRTKDWLKFKAVREVDAVVGGWTDPQGSRQYFGSLLVGLYEGEALRFIGGVGTGFANKTEKDLFEKLEEIVQDECPFESIPKTRQRPHWTKPKYVARVGYAEWTSDKQLRQPRFLGLQPDRSAKESTFAKELKVTVIKTPSKEAEPRATGSSRRGDNARRSFGAEWEALQDKKQEELRLRVDGQEIKLTHLNKVYFPKEGYTKRDVLSYYAAVSPILLPFLKDRPLVLHRFPNGIKGNSFYQKEAGENIPDWIRTANIFSETKRQKVAYFLIDDLASLLYVTNLGCIEHNPFSARQGDLEKPDYMFIDLDPTGGTKYSRVVLAAKALEKVLKKARLKSYVKTSGATGMHIYIPIARKYRFEQVRALLEIVTRMAAEEEKGLLTRIFRVRERPRNTVFVDVRQNAYAQSLAAVFSLRPREGAPASTPIDWKELKEGLQPEQWNIRTVIEDLPTRAKLWEDFWEHKQTLEGAVDALEAGAT